MPHDRKMDTALARDATAGKANFLGVLLILGYVFPFFPRRVKTRLAGKTLRSRRIGIPNGCGVAPSGFSSDDSLILPRAASAKTAWGKTF
jgi:hypothetical protein